MSVHQSSLDYLTQTILPGLSAMNGASQDLSCGTRVIDLGCQQPGGLAAGVALAELCLAGLGRVDVVTGGLTGQQITVRTDQPLQTCMASQYAGWPISVGKFFSMGSGAMRAARGKEKMLKELELVATASATAGILESAQLPDDEVATAIAAEAGVSPEQLTLVVARTASLAGTIQIVARSVETCLHKLHELGFDLRCVQSGFGSAPLPPIAAKDLPAMGWTNDAILYGGSVTLWVHCDDTSLGEIIPQVPSAASGDFGLPFLETFEKYERDFYKIDPHLFSPAEVTVINRATGSVFRAGGLHPDILRRSFQWPD